MRRAVPVVLVVLALLFPIVIAAVLIATGDDSARSGSGGSSSDRPSAVPEPDDEGARTSPSVPLRSFYDQKLSWSSCGDGNDCAELRVPLDYADPTGDTIEIKVLRNPADVPSERVGELVVNPGGPGASGVDLAKRDASFGSAITSRFDIIGFDPRGTGGSTPVDCLSDGELDDYLTGDPDPDDDAEVRAYLESSERFGEGCRSRSGALAAHVSTHEAARDMDVLRAALGESKLTYLGFSYGTKLGATYADLFPERSGRMVLDGAIDPTLTARESSLEQAHGFEVALTAYVDHCVEQAPCYLGSTREKALARISEFVEGLDQKPLRVGRRELTEGLAFYGLILPLYGRDSWQYLDTALGDAFKGDASTLLLLADQYNDRNDDGSYANNSSEAIGVINCLDDPTSIDAAQVPAEFPVFRRASPTFGKVFAWGLTYCRGLVQEKPKPVDWHLDAKGADPILVIGTTRDPATPLRWAQALAAQLDSGVLVTRDGDGHTGYNQGNSCVDEAVEGYLIEGTAPSRDLTC